MPDPVDVHVGRRIREARLLAGTTQSELAIAIGVQFQQLQKYETAVNRISASRLWRLARYLDVPITSLFPATNEKGETEFTKARTEDLTFLRLIMQLDETQKVAVRVLVKTMVRD